MDIKKVANRIKSERSANGFTQTQLAEKLSVAPQTVNGWEGARRVPDIQTLSILADMFDCSVDYLVCRTDKRNAAVINETVGDSNVKIEMNKDCFEKMSPADVKDLLSKLKEVGFDLSRLI